MTDFEKFIRERGYKYKTEEEIKAAYDRHWKVAHDIVITEDEFLAEVKPEDEQHAEAAKETYAMLVKLIEAKKLEPSDVYRYAVYRWCLFKPKALVAYECERGRWEVNNCDTEISVERAVVEVNREWGFEASRVQIIGTPYYDATDWMFIRFNCAHMTWLYTNGNLYQVYE